MLSAIAWYWTTWAVFAITVVCQPNCGQGLTWTKLDALTLQLGLDHVCEFDGSAFFNSHVKSPLVMANRNYMGAPETVR
jgi:hypothetical protein